MDEERFVSPLAHLTDAEVGEGSKIWHFCNLYACRVGRYSQIGSYCEIRKGATVGDHCRFQSQVIIGEDCVVKDYVFIAPFVVLLNDSCPSAVKAIRGEWNLQPVTIEEYSVIGGGTTLLPGVTVGARAVVGAGSVVSRDVDPFGVYRGAPAKKVGDLRESPYRERWPELLEGVAPH